MAAAAEEPGLSRMPSELLHQILLLLSPSDLAALSCTCRDLHLHISISEHLWRQTYDQRWDRPSICTSDPLVVQPCPSTRRPPTSKSLQGKSADNGAPSRINESRLFLDLNSYEHAGSFDCKTQVQRRTWAEHQIRRLQDRPFNLVSNYNDTMRTLLSIARSRQSRQDGNEADTSASCQYLIDLLTSNEGYETFKKLIYPRTDISRLCEWQRKTQWEKHGKTGPVAVKSKADGDKRNRSTSGASSLRDVKRRKTTVKETTAPSRSRRRSTRLLLHTYPAELHHLLFDKDGNDVIDLDNGQGIRTLEELELLDEQLAAELHVLHGIRPSKKQGKAIPMSNTGADASEPSEEDGEPQGTEADEEEAEEEDDDDSSDDEDDLNHLFHFHHNHYHHHHHLPLEQPLGSDNGYEGDTILRGRAREMVYDTSNYGPENSYGPLRAWRERWDVIDGTRPADRLRQSQDTTPGGEEEEDNVGSISSGSEHTHPVSVIDLTHEDDEAAEADVEQLYEVLQDVGWNPEWDPDPDPDFESDMDDDEYDDDEDEEDVLMMEGRELDIALSHGLHPYYESRRWKQAMLDHDVKTGRQRGWPVSFAKGVLDDGVPRPLDSVWRMEKRIDWVLLEAVMVVMSCNLRHAVVNHGWGRAFRLPGSSRSLTGQDAEARRLYSSQSPDIFPSAWRNLLCLPCGWNHSRGDERKAAPVGGEEGATPDVDRVKPYDWASVEKTWIGTYAFLDWSKWAAYNARDPLSRGFADSSQSSDPCKPMPLKVPGSMANLKHEREAVGDCLQLRMELLPLSEQKPVTPRDEALHELEGPRSAKYPPLRFKGHTVTYLEEGPPTMRGQVHGMVSPVFAPQDEEYYSRNDDTSSGGDIERAIVGLHWQLTHAYEGEDRWSLSGIQPGPPGSRAPIYGIWGSSDRTDNLSPCGPFTYMRVSDMPWKQVDQLLQERR